MLFPEKYSIVTFERWSVFVFVEVITFDSSKYFSHILAFKFCGTTLYLSKLDPEILILSFELLFEEMTEFVCLTFSIEKTFALITGLSLKYFV